MRTNSIKISKNISEPFFFFWLKKTVRNVWKSLPFLVRSLSPFRNFSFALFDLLVQDLNEWEAVQVAGWVALLRLIETFKWAANVFGTDALQNYHRTSKLNVTSFGSVLATEITDYHKKRPITSLIRILSRTHRTIIQRRPANQRRFKFSKLCSIK